MGYRRPTVLNYWKQSWKLDPVWCPCDIELTELIELRGIENATFFHFGTGEHHHVGIFCADAGKRNSVLAITASREEYASYVDLVIERPEVARWYTAFFGDVYLLNPALLPPLDVATLFHLCEFRTGLTDDYGGLTDLELARLLIDKLKPAGLLLFYEASAAFAKAAPIVEELERLGLVVRDGAHKHLLVYRKA